MGKRCFLRIKRLRGGKHIHIGDRVTILWGARLEAVRRYAGRSFSPEIRIGNDVAIGQNLHCTCTNSVTIGDHACLTAHVTITDTHHSYEDIGVPIVDNPLASDPVSIGPSSFIANGAVILPGTQIGRHSFVGANSVVKGRFGDYCVIVGAPARVVRRYDPEKQEWVRIPHGSPLVSPT